MLYNEYLQKVALCRKILSEKADWKRNAKKTGLREG
jgi:hypothetical protein